MKNLLAKFIEDDSGTTSVEFGLVAAGLSFAIIAIIQGIADNVPGLLAAIKSGPPLP